MSAVLQLTRHKLTVDEYHRMGEAGLFAPGSRVELIDGEIFDMAPIGSVHASIVTTLSMFLSRAVSQGERVTAQSSIRLLPDSEPQPDILVLKARPDRYSASLPTPADVLLLIEVADSSLHADRQEKVPLYARHGIAEVWLFDVAARQLEIYTEPNNGAYSRMLRLAADGAITPSLFPVPPLPLAEIWPA